MIMTKSHFLKRSSFAGERLKKSKWVNGPKLPVGIFLFYASASSINSTHVIFVGANTNFDDQREKIQGVQDQISLT